MKVTRKLAALSTAALSTIALFGSVLEVKAQPLFFGGNSSASQRPLTRSELQHFCDGYLNGYNYRNGSCWNNAGGGVSVNQEFARRWLTNQGYWSNLACVGKPDAADGSWSAESYTRPAREKQGGLIVPIHLPTKHSPRQQWRGFCCPKPCHPVGGETWLNKSLSRGR